MTEHILKYKPNLLNEFLISNKVKKDRYQNWNIADLGFRVERKAVTRLGLAFLILAKLLKYDSPASRVDGRLISRCSQISWI
jgi:hypothetical protein